jgi:hypothetical protein
MPPRSLNELDAQIAALKRKLREAAPVDSSGSDRRARALRPRTHARTPLPHALD